MTQQIRRTKMKRNKLRWMAPRLALAFIATACGNDDDDTSTGDDGAAEPAGDDSESCIGEEGCVPANQPDVNGDGTVKIGVLSPGDTNDNGYYESFVLTAREVAEEEGWELTILVKVNPADSAEQARNLCRPEVDMVAIAAGELADASPVAAEEVCAGAVWYVAGGAGVEPTPSFFQTSDNPGQNPFVPGHSPGRALPALGEPQARAGSGPALALTP